MPRELKAAEPDGTGEWERVSEDQFDLPGLRGSILRQSVSILGSTGHKEQALARISERER